MNTFEFYRKIEKINETVIRKIGIESVLDNEDVILNDSIEANLSGLTFAGNFIDAAPPFSDWHETGEFHQNLNFSKTNDIEFSSQGKGFKAITETFNEKDVIAPTAKTLKVETLNKIIRSFIEKIQL